jgi:hypothetical protein
MWLLALADYSATKKFYLGALLVNQVEPTIPHCTDIFDFLTSHDND